jgi:hypothetical protein
MDYKHVTIEKRDVGPYPVKIGWTLDPERYVRKDQTKGRGSDRYTDIST